MKKTGKHVMFIPRWYPSDTDAMLGLFVKNHARAAVYAGYTISVAYASPSKEELKNRFRINLISDEGITEAIVYYSSVSKIRFLLQLVAWYKAIRLAVRANGKPDLIHAHVLTRAGIIAWILSISYNVSYIITEHWSRYFAENMNYKGFLRKLLTRMVIRNSSHVSVVSKRLFEAMTRNGLNFQFNLLPNVVDTRLFGIRTHKSQTFRFISITCFEDKSKNLTMLINAAVHLKQSQTAFELIMIGDGADRKKIENHALQQGLDVTFTGMLNPEETAALLSQCDCLVLSSNYETFGIVVYEALACGIPVITTDVADLKELVDNKSGIVIPVGDPEALTDAMAKMILNYNYDSEYLRRKVVKHYSTDSVANVLDSIYQQFIKL